MGFVPQRPDDPLDTLVIIALVVSAFVLAVTVEILEWTGILPLTLH